VIVFFGIGISGYLTLGGPGVLIGQESQVNATNGTSWSDAADTANATTGNAGLALYRELNRANGHRALGNQHGGMFDVNVEFLGHVLAAVAEGIRANVEGSSAWKSTLDTQPDADKHDTGVSGGPLRSRPRKRHQKNLLRSRGNSLKST